MTYETFKKNIYSITKYNNTIYVIQSLYVIRGLRCTVLQRILQCNILPYRIISLDKWTKIQKKVNYLLIKYKKLKIGY